MPISQRKNVSIHPEQIPKTHIKIGYPIAQPHHKINVSNFPADNLQQQMCPISCEPNTPNTVNNE